jgi:hypothetical protein
MEKITRKATITKDVRLTEKTAAFQVVKELEKIKLKKGTEVLVTDEGYWKGRKQYSLKLADGSNPNTFKVTDSQFEFSDKMKFMVLVSRISYASQNIEVEALNDNEAKKLALIEAGGLEFREHDADYEVDAIVPSE